MNYIKQLTSAMILFSEDDRLNPTHVSMYLALFQMWNLNRFRNPVSINRGEVMALSKIGSLGTYHKCIRDLHNWEYLKYMPSKNPLKGSKVYMFKFETSTRQESEQLEEQEPKQVQVPSINTLNKKKTNKPIKQGRDKSRFAPPQLDEVKGFFLEEKSTTDQAEQFHNHFESNGWLVGGKAKMKDWNAAARNWIKRSEKFNNSTLRHSKGGRSGSENDRLNTNQNKDYSIPL